LSPTTVSQFPSLHDALPILAGDWGGHHVKTVGTVDRSTETWYLRNENSGGPADVAAPFRFGAPGWVPLVGDWNRNGAATSAGPRSEEHTSELQSLAYIVCRL